MATTYEQRSVCITYVAGHTVLKILLVVQMLLCWRCGVRVKELY